jgi:flagellar basal body-associated protein FliL
MVRTSTNDPAPHSVIVDMILYYDENSTPAQTELIGRVDELRDFVRRYFRGKRADELVPENEDRLKQEIIEQLNTRMFNTARVRQVTFNQLDVLQMP